MIKFLLKGVLRDKNRSLLPIIVVAIGVMLTVLLSGWINGIFGDAIEMTAKFRTGHVKIVTKEMAKNGNMQDNGLALLDVSGLMDTLKADFLQFDFTKRINFGGLIDISDEDGNTIAQGPAYGLAIDMLSDQGKDIERLGINSSLVKGKLPGNQKEILISDEFLNKLKLGIGDSITFMGSTMYGSLCFYVFKIAGTVNFGTSVLDKGSIIVDLKDAEIMLDMNNAATEILGFTKNGFYDEKIVDAAKTKFNKLYENDGDDFAPTMLRLRDQQNMEFMLTWIKSVGGIMVSFFIFAMSLILWNTGLIGGLRRYNEFGIRLAMGEMKNHIFRTLLIESIAIGLIGTIIGTIIGISISYYLQNHGINFGEALKNSAMMLPKVYRSRVELSHWFIGLIPGIFSVLAGSALAGIGIYKRQTATLFKEFEN